MMHQSLLRIITKPIKHYFARLHYCDFLKSPWGAESIQSELAHKVCSSINIYKNLIQSTFGALYIEHSSHEFDIQKNIHHINAKMKRKLSLCIQRWNRTIIDHIDVKITLVRHNFLRHFPVATLMFILHFIRDIFPDTLIFRVVWGCFSSIYEIKVWIYAHSSLVGTIRS